MSTTALPTEHQEQKAFFEWWDAWSRNLPYLAFAIPNGGARNAVTGAMLKREGVLKGVFDIFIGWPRNGKHGILIEMKRRKGGEVTKEQISFKAKMEAAGYECHICKGWEEAKQVVVNYAFGREVEVEQRI